MKYSHTETKRLALVFVVLKPRQLSDNEEEVDEGEVREALGGDVDLGGTHEEGETTSLRR